jgi:hypothetical protein
LTPDARLRAREVCRAWRAAFSEPTLWTVLDLSAPITHDEHGRVQAPRALLPRRYARVLRAASQLAAGGLRELYVSGCIPHCLRMTPLLAALEKNAGALHVLRARDSLDSGAVWALLHAAPRLERFELDTLECGVTDACAALRNEAPFAALRARCVSVGTRWQVGNLTERSFDIAAALLAHQHATVTELRVCSVAYAAMAPLVDAALARRLTSLKFDGGVGLLPAHLPLLSRLVREGALETLELVVYETFRPADGDARWAELCAALAASTTLRRLTLTGLCNTPGAIAALCAGLVRHPVLERLSFSSREYLDQENIFVDQIVNSAALAALLTANAPTLAELRLPDAYLGEAGMRLVLAALTRNTHVRVLDCVCHSFDFEQAPWQRLSARFVADVLLPAVRANTSLRTLKLALDETYWPEEAACNAEAILQDLAARGEEMTEEEHARATKDAYYKRMRVPDDVRMARTLLEVAERMVSARDDAGARGWTVAYQRWTERAAQQAAARRAATASHAAAAQ